MVYRLIGIVYILFLLAAIIFGCYLMFLVVKALRKYVNSKEVREEKKEVRKSLAELLKEHRIRCKMTQEFVSETIGVSRQAVSRWENGSADPSTSNLIALANLYQVSAEELLKNATSKKYRQICLQLRRRVKMIETIRSEHPCQAPKWKILNATTIKLIAVLLMVFDHIHQMYAWNGAPLWLTILGRPVFPMFLFISAESFHYTHNRKKYLMRLLFASWGMTIITTALSMLVPNPNIVLMNNAFSTFFVTGLYMQFWDWFIDSIKQKNGTQVVKSILCCFIPILCAAPMLLVGTLSANENIPFVAIRAFVMLAMFVPNILTVEGGFLLVVLGVLFYIFREKRIIQIVVLLLLSAAVYLLNRGGIASLRSVQRAAPLAPLCGYPCALAGKMHPLPGHGLPHPNQTAG